MKIGLGHKPAKLKWSKAGLILRTRSDKWTIPATQWILANECRRRGRPSKRCRDE